MLVPIVVCPDKINGVANTNDPVNADDLVDSTRVVVLYGEVGSISIAELQKSLPIWLVLNFRLVFGNSN